MSIKTIFLDRDGVINKEVNYLYKIKDFEFIDGIFDVCLSFKKAGYQIIIVSNQSGIGRGLFDIETMNAINKKMLDLLAQVGGHIDAIFYCPHTEDANCKCRKPKSGMLEEISTRFGVSLKNIPAVGDAARDLEAYQSVSAQPILVKTGKGEDTFVSKAYPKNTWIFNDLFEAAEAIIEKY
jgi:D-glycero-D-manno-heptose 1,7-bisphosphate phosphatase